MSLSPFPVSRTAAPFFYFLFTLFCAQISTQTIFIQLRQPPPNQPRLDDILEITLAYIDSSSENPIHSGVISYTSPGEGLVTEKSVSHTRGLYPKILTTISSKISPAHIQLTSQAFKDAFHETSNTLSGYYYTICISGQEVTNGRSLGES